MKFQIRKNVLNSIIFPTRFLGLNADCTEQLEIEKRFITNKLDFFENKKVGFKVKSQGEEYSFTTEQIMAYYLTKLKKYYANAEINAKEMVISVPSYCTNVERQALLDAAEIAGIKCLRLINESTALALQYGFFRKKDLDPKEERFVAFVDLGHSKTTITIAGFLRDSTRVITHKSDRNLGAREMDWLLAEKLGKEFNKKYDTNIFKNSRAMLRILEAVEKGRKFLSSVTDAQVNVEYLAEEEDLNRTIKKDEFEELIAPLIERFTALCQDAIASSGK